jgi:hypothetical protein
MLLIVLILSTGYVQIVANMLLHIQAVVLLRRTLDCYLSPVARCGLGVWSGIPGTWVRFDAHQPQYLGVLQWSGASGLVNTAVWVEVGHTTRAVLDAVGMVTSITAVWVEVGHTTRVVLHAVCKVSSTTAVWMQVGHTTRAVLFMYVLLTRC